MPFTESSIVVDGSGTSPAKPRLHFWNRSRGIIEEMNRSVESEKVRIVLFSHRTFHDVSGCTVCEIPESSSLLCLFQSFKNEVHKGKVVSELKLFSVAPF